MRRLLSYIRANLLLAWKIQTYLVTDSMPEIPELEAIAQRLTEAFSGKTIRGLSVHNHLVIHGTTVERFEGLPTGKVFQSFDADGKFIIAGMSDSLQIVINPMLTGRFRISTRPRKPLKSDVLSVSTDGPTLWYDDRKFMSRVYLVSGGDYKQVAGFIGRGPSALDPELTLESFRTHIRSFHGQTKNVIQNQRFVKGIGNAYADEILLYAGILPFRRRGSLDDGEMERLYVAMRSVLGRYRDMLSTRSLIDLGPEKRDFLMIHGKGGGICPLCGGRISEVTANRFKTNYCQNCQR